MRAKWREGKMAKGWLLMKGIIPAISALVVFMLFVSSGRCLHFEYFPSGQSGGAAPFEHLWSFTANARAAGVGNAYTAGSDADSPYWNPAGISRIYYNQINVTNIALFLNTKFATVNMAVPIDKKNFFGMGMGLLSSGEAEKTDSTGRTFGNFSETSNSYIITYSRAISGEFAWGANIKILSQSIDNYSALFHTADLGVLYRYGADTTHGICLQNLIPTQYGSDRITPNLRGGLSQIFIPGRLTGFFDTYILEIFVKPVFRWSAGVEFRAIDNLILRGGLNHREFTLGFGLSSRRVTFDYALGIHPVDLVHKFSINLMYGFIPGEEEKIVLQQINGLETEKKLFHEKKRIETERIRAEREKLALETWSRVKLSIAEKHFESGDYKQAEKTLKEITSKDPQNNAATEMLKEINRLSQKDYLNNLYFESRELYKKTDYQGSLMGAKKVLSIAPDHRGASIVSFLSQSQLFLKDKKYNEAKSELMEMMKIDPKNEEGVALLKRIHTIIEIMEMTPK